MEIGINLSIQNLKETLINEINDSKLPPGVTQLILKDILAQIQLVNAELIKIEKEQLEQKQKEGAKDGKEIHKD